MVSFCQYNLNQITQSADAIFAEFLAIQMDDQKWIDAITKATGDSANIQYSFDAWQSRLKLAIGDTKSLDKKRVFSKSLKHEMWLNDKTCAICNNEIKTINDAAMDHAEHYWRGGETIPENARLVHRLCNLTRSH